MSTSKSDLLFDAAAQAIQGHLNAFATLGQHCTADDVANAIDALSDWADNQIPDHLLAKEPE